MERLRSFTRYGRTSYKPPRFRRPRIVRSDRLKAVISLVIFIWARMCVCLECGQGDWSAKQIALICIAAELRKKLALSLSFNPLGDDFQTQTFA